MKINNESQYDKALARIDELWGDEYPEACTSEYVEIQELVLAVEEYEDEQ